LIDIFLNGTEYDESRELLKLYFIKNNVTSNEEKQKLLIQLLNSCNEKSLSENNSQTIMDILQDSSFFVLLDNCPILEILTKRIFTMVLKLSINQ
jgi:hypothetical protein